MIWPEIKEVILRCESAIEELTNPIVVCNSVYAKLGDHIRNDLEKEFKNDSETLSLIDKIFGKSINPKYDKIVNAVRESVNDSRHRYNSIDLDEVYKSFGALTALINSITEADL